MTDVIHIKTELSLWSINLTTSSSTWFTNEYKYTNFDQFTTISLYYQVELNTPVKHFGSVGQTLSATINSGKE